MVLSSFLSTESDRVVNGIKKLILMNSSAPFCKDANFVANGQFLNIVPHIYSLKMVLNRLS